MKNAPKYVKFAYFIGFSTLSLAASQPVSAQYMPPYVPQTNHLQMPSQGYAAPLGAQIPANMPPQSINAGAYMGSQPPYNRNYYPYPHRVTPNFGTNYPNPAYRNLKDHLIGKRKIPYQIPAKLPYTGHFQRWVDFEPEYKLYPGDQLDIVVSSAPEMSRTLTIGPDGRIVMPHIQPTMAAGRTFTELKGSLELQLASVLRDPTLAVTPRAYSPEQIYIGGEVTRQGTFTLSGPTGVLEAIIMSGGLLASAKSKQIAVLRRSPNGGMMMRTIDLKNGLKNIREYNDNMQLRRNDVIFVPRKDIAEIGIWVSNLRNALPINFSYQLGNNNGGFNGNITP